MLVTLMIFETWAMAIVHLGSPSQNSGTGRLEELKRWYWALLGFRPRQLVPYRSVREGPVDPLATGVAVSLGGSIFPTSISLLSACPATYSPLTVFSLHCLILR